MANGIQAAHNKNIIHRDIKPQNVIISKEGKVKVTDFGIAKAANSNTMSSTVLGQYIIHRRNRREELQVMREVIFILLGSRCMRW